MFVVGFTPGGVPYGAVERLDGSEMDDGGAFDTEDEPF
jgi:hypothetical protein